MAYIPGVNDPNAPIPPVLTPDEVNAQLRALTQASPGPVTLASPAPPVIAGLTPGIPLQPRTDAERVSEVIAGAGTQPMPRSSLGSRIAPGEPIPPAQMIPAYQAYRPDLSAAQAGRLAYQEMRPQITANAGTEPVQYAQQQRAQLLFDQQHPWGSPISPHPGLGGKILHGLAMAGNIAGDIIAPATMMNIPGTQLNREMQARMLTGDIEREQEMGIRQSELQARQALAQVELARAQQQKAGTLEWDEQQGLVRVDPVSNTATQVTIDGKPIKKPQELAQVYSAAVQDAVNRGVDPSQDPKVQAYADAITGIQRQPAEKDKPPVVNYDQGIPVSVTSGGKTYDRNDRNMPLELRPLLQSADAAHNQRVREEAAQQARGFAQQQRMFEARQAAPTTQQRNVAAQARVAAEGIPLVVAEIDRLKNQVGFPAGRWNEFMQGNIGMDNPDFAGLRSDLLMVSSAVALAHARGRLPENLREEFDRAINAPRQSPENLKAALNHILPWMQRMEDFGQPGAGVGAGGAGAGARGAGGSRGGGGADPFAQFGGRAR